MKVGTMTISDYQTLAYTAVQPHKDNREEILHWTIGLTEEAGEVASLVKHKYFHNEEIEESEIAEELGDVLWYLSAMCTALGIDFSSVAQLNIEKLSRRFKDGVYKDENVFDRHNNDNQVKELASEIIQIRRQ